MSPVRKFAVTIRTRYERVHYLIEAADHAHARALIDARPEREASETIRWQAHHTDAWLRAWDAGDVKPLRGRKLPEGIE